MSNVENLILEHLKKIQAEQTAARDRDAQIMSRLGQLESGIARISQDEAANYSEIVEDRHAVDKLTERIASRSAWSSKARSPTPSS